MTEQSRRKVVLYHGGCVDGYTAAWIALQAAPDAELIPCGYQQDPPDGLAGADVLFVDFSYKRPVMEKIAANAASLTVLDHHKSAEADLDGLALAYSDTLVVFDMERSGAGIAWDWFNPGVPRPAFVDIVEDRDLWRRSIPGGAEVFALASATPHDPAAWTELACGDIGKLVERGSAIAMYRDQQIGIAVSHARRAVIAGHDVPVVNTYYNIGSEAAGALAEGEPFAAYYLDGSDVRHWGLRSTSEGLDVSEIAMLFGGGGHRNAAGFRTSLGSRLDVILP